MSGNSFRCNTLQHTAPRSAGPADPTDDAVIDQALALYGSAAATAIAYCALDAWFDDDKAEFHRFAGMFRRLRN